MSKTISQIITEHLNKNERTKAWLAKKLDMPQPSIYKKFNADYFTAIEFLRTAKILNIDIAEVMEGLDNICDKRELERKQQ